MPLLRRIRRWFKRLMEAAVPPEFDREGLETLAGALCCVAAGAHSKNPAEQEQIAATFFNCAMTGFEGIKADEAVQAFVRDMIQKAKK